MILGFEEVLNKISNAQNIIAVVNYTDPAAFSAGIALNKIKNVKPHFITPNFKQFDIKQKYDLALFVGFHNVYNKKFKIKDSIIFDDSISDTALYSNDKYFIVSKKNYRPSEFSSHAHFAYKLLSEFGIETNFDLDLLLLLGDRDDNKELGITEFQKQIYDEYSNKLDFNPNFIGGLGEYKIFNCPSFLIFFDYLDYVGFSYITKHRALKNRVELHSFLSEFNLNNLDLAIKLINLFEDYKISKRVNDLFNLNQDSEDLLYAPSYGQYSLDEMLVGLGNFLYHVKSKGLNASNYTVLYRTENKKFFEKGNLQNFVSAFIAYMKDRIKDDVFSYVTKPILFKNVGDYTLYHFMNQKSNFSKWNWLPFFSWGSIIVDYTPFEDKMYFEIYSKSNVNAGVLSLLASRFFTTDIPRGDGNGEYFKAKMIKRGNLKTMHSISKVLRDISTIDDAKHPSSIDNYMLYHSIVHGTPGIFILPDKEGKQIKIDVYPPYKIQRYGVSPDEMIKFIKEYNKPLTITKDFN